MYKTQQSYDEMNDDFIQFDSDMSHVDDEDLFSLAERITVPEPHIINEMWSDDDKYTWQDVANCLRDNWHEIKGLVSLTDRDKMTDFAFDNYFEWVNKGKLINRQPYYLVDLNCEIELNNYDGFQTEILLITFGLVHLTRESAEQHSHALFKINNQVAKWKQ